MNLKVCAVLLMVMLGVLMVGCGNKGPLYLPDAAEEKQKRELTK